MSSLNINSPRYKETDQLDKNVVGISIDSTGLKRFGRDEWHQEKHKIAAKRSWHKLHIAVDDNHIIHGAAVTDLFTSDDKMVGTLIDQIDVDVDVEHVTADGAYDNNPIYDILSNQFPDADIIIPLDSDAVYNSASHPQRNRNLQEIKTFGRINWQ